MRPAITYHFYEMLTFETLNLVFRYFIPFVEFKQAIFEFDLNTPCLSSEALSNLSKNGLIQRQF